MMTKTLTRIVCMAMLMAVLIGMVRMAPMIANAKMVIVDVDRCGDADDCV